MSTRSVATVHQCQQCDRVFARKYCLTVHTKTHIPRDQRQRPFRCTKDGCSHAFTTKQDRERHESTHSSPDGEFACEHCGKFFPRKSSLNRHVKLARQKGGCHMLLPGRSSCLSDAQPMDYPGEVSHDVIMTADSITNRTMVSPKLKRSDAIRLGDIGVEKVLLDAIKRGDNTATQRILEVASPQTYDDVKDLNAGLLCAVSCKNREAVKSLIMAGASVHADSEGTRRNVCLDFALEANDIDLAEFLLDLRASRYAQGPRYISELEMGFEFRVSLEMSTMVASRLKTMRQLNLALRTSSKSGDFQKTNLLLALNASPNFSTARYEETSLVLACRSGNVSVVEALLSAGADLEARHSYGYSPLALACRWSDAPLVQALLSAGADLAVRDDFGNMPLHIACEWSNVPVVRALLSAGADLEAKDMSGNTPLLEARDSATVLALLTAGADAKSQNHSLESPLMRVCKRLCMDRNLRKGYSKHEDVLRHLLVFKADVNIANVFEQSPLFCIARCLIKDGAYYAGPVERAATLLLQYGSAVNKKDIKGRTVTDLTVEGIGEVRKSGTDDHPESRTELALIHFSGLLWSWGGQKGDGTEVMSTLETSHGVW